MNIVNLGNYISNIGLKIMPFSFGMYFLVSFLAYKWKYRHFLKLVKAIWYICNVIMAITKDGYAETIAIMILCFEASDSIFDYFEEKRNRYKKTTTIK